MRQFETGATRNTDTGRIDPEAFIDPRVLLEYSNYMNRNRLQADGTTRAGDNWQKGIPKEAYAKSLNRHHLDFWLNHRGHKTEADQLTNLMAILFNAMGYAHELLKEQNATSTLTDQDKAELKEFVAEHGRISPKEVIDGEEEFIGDTHRYGALAVPTRKEISWEEAEDLGYFRGTRIPEGLKIKVTSLRGVSSVDTGEVLGVSAERAQSQGQPLATQVRSQGESEAGVLGN